MHYYVISSVIQYSLALKPFQTKFDIFIYTLIYLKSVIYQSLCAYSYFINIIAFEIYVLHEPIKFLLILKTYYFNPDIKNKIEIMKTLTMKMDQKIISLR